MSDEERFQAWLDKVCARPLPQNATEQIRILARELAEGAEMRFWPSVILAHFVPVNNLPIEYRRLPKDRFITEYLNSRWKEKYLDLQLLESFGYIRQKDKWNFQLTEKAFDSVKEVELTPTNIFISYKRSESSAFALLILKSLEWKGLGAFLDLALEAGENFHAGLKDRVQKSDYLVLLLGKETLTSDYVQREIQWAYEVGLTIIPIWHNGFKYQLSEIDQKLKNTHAITVKEESAAGYNIAITELLNRFGITP